MDNISYQLRLKQTLSSQYLSSPKHPKLIEKMLSKPVPAPKIVTSTIISYMLLRTHLIFHQLQSGSYGRSFLVRVLMKASHLYSQLKNSTAIPHTPSSKLIYRLLPALFTCAQLYLFIYNYFSLISSMESSVNYRKYLCYRTFMSLHTSKY